MSVDINISLATRNQPNVNLTVGDDAQNLIIGTNNTTPVITSVLTGPPGPSGAAGTPDIGAGEITNSMIANGAVTGSKIGNQSVLTSNLNSSCVTVNQLANNAVTTSKIANNAVTAAKIAPGAITEELNGIFANGSITGVKIKDGDIDSQKLKAESITAPKLAANSVVTGKIINGAVTGVKLENDIVIPGAKINGMFQLLGNSPAYLLGPTQDDLHIQSEAGLIFKVDHDNNGNNTFKFRNGSDSDVITIDENGNVTITGNITVNGTVDGVDVSSLPTTDTNTQLPLLDEDNMASNSSLSVPSQQSVKAYVDSQTHLELGTTSTTALAGNTITISTAQANAIIANTAKVSFPGLGTSSTTALAGNTALLQLGTSGTTALAGNTTTISGTQASAITANTAKTGITTSQANAITANTAKPDLTVDGAGTINANNVPTLNQNTTGNAATATALSAGNKTIDGSLDIGASQAGHDFTLHGATTQFSNIVWDASMNHLKVADASKIVFGNGLSAVDFDSSIQADGSNLVIYNDTGNIQLGDTVEITGNLTVTGTVDGIDIATDVAANTAKTSFPGFGTSASTALAGNTTIPTQYTNANAVSAVATADDYLKNDADDTMSGSLTLEGSLFVQRSDGGNTTKTKIVNNSTTGNKTLNVPDASGIIATTNVHHHFIHAGWFMSYPYARYIPLNGSLNEQNTATLSPEYVNFTFPYDGYVKKMMLRSETNMGSTNLKLYKGATGATVTTVLGDVTATVGASAAVEFDFSSVSNAYSKGDTMAVKIDPTEDPDGGQNITIELIFDLTT